MGQVDFFYGVWKMGHFQREHKDYGEDPFAGKLNTFPQLLSGPFGITE
jgi:hypothetical protein